MTWPLLIHTPNDRTRPNRMLTTFLSWELSHIASQSYFIRPFYFSFVSLASDALAHLQRKAAASALKAEIPYYRNFWESNLSNNIQNKLLVGDHRIWPTFILYHISNFKRRKRPKVLTFKQSWCNLKNIIHLL